MYRPGGVSLGLAMRADVAILVVMTVVVSGCSGNRGSASGDVGTRPITGSDGAAPEFDETPSDGGDRVVRFSEVFEKSGSVLIGARGYNYLCGGLTEFGAGTFDTAQVEWDIPAREHNGSRAAVEIIELTMKGGGPGQVEGFLYTPNETELGRSYTMTGPGLGEERPLLAKGTFEEGVYRIVVRVCGPDTSYSFKAEAKYVA